MSGFLRGKPGPFLWDLGDYSLRQWMQRVARRTTNQTGMVAFSDGQHDAVGNSQAVNPAAVPSFDGSDVYADEAWKDDIDDIFNTDYSQFTFEEGSAYHITFTCLLQTTLKTNELFTFYFSDGVSIITNRAVLPFPTPVNTDHFVVWDTVFHARGPEYSGAGWELRAINSTGGSMSMWNKTLAIAKLHGAY